MANKPRKLSAPKGALPVLQYCTPTQLQVDPMYQRELDARSYQLIDRIAADWNWGLCQPLVVAQRVDRSLWVVDGQHRLQAAKQRGDIPQLPCVIFQPADPADEAATFVLLNQERRPLSPYALWNAALCAGDDQAASLAAILQSLNMKFVGSADNQTLRAGQFNSVTTIRKWHARHGDKRTRDVLTCIARAFVDQPLPLGNALFRAIGAVLIERGEIDVDLFIGILADRDQDEWLAEFHRQAAEQAIGIQAAATSVLALAYAEAVDDEPVAPAQPRGPAVPRSRGPAVPRSREDRPQPGAVVNGGSRLEMDRS